MVDDATHEAVAIIPERAIFTWEPRRGVKLFLIEPGKPNQNVYIELFNWGRDKYPKDHWFTSLPHAKVVIDAWRREYNEERSNKSLGGLTHASYARKLTKKAVPLPTGL